MKIIFSIIFAFITFQSNSQNSKFIEYKLTQLSDKQDKTFIHSEDFKLNFNDVISEFYSQTLHVRDSIRKNSAGEFSLNGSYKVINPMVPRKMTHEEIFVDVKKLEVLKSEKNKYGIFVIKEKKPIIWSISDESLIVLDKKCQKATATFKGRNWEVWFTNEIPVSLGPWKLVGLPGMILKASDDKKEVIFEATKISEVSNVPIQFPRKFENIKSEKALRELIQTYDENPDLAPSDIAMVKGKLIKKGDKNPKPITNPIELEE